jgi:hypothetical protein
MSKASLLKTIEFGQRVAEEETNLLVSYFVETDHWHRVYSGEVDVVYGPKGSGKSAIYSLLVSRIDNLFDKNIILIPAENPRGTPAFRNLATNPPASEREFIGLWKLYFISLLQGVFEDYELKGVEVRQIESSLASAGLIRGKRTLESILRSVMDYAHQVFRPQSLELGVDFDPVTQMPKGFKGKISFSEPTAQASSEGCLSIDNLLNLANLTLSKNSNYIIWILLDRLDVAFSEDIELEHNALRALFRVYLDMMGLSNIRLKIFLRTDIWNRLTTEGFREASHITRCLTINWNESSLLNLIVRRAIYNPALQEYYDVTPTTVLDSYSSQQTLFYRMCPDQVDVGRNKPKTFQWVLGRTKDASGHNAPRELIHLLNQLKDVQIKRLEIGEAEPDGDQLFARAAFKDALPEVSRARLEQTLYAEHPSLRDALEKLRG